MDVKLTKSFTNFVLNNFTSTSYSKFRNRRALVFYIDVCSTFKYLYTLHHTLYYIQHVELTKTFIFIFPYLYNTTFRLYIYTIDIRRKKKKIPEKHKKIHFWYITLSHSHPFVRSPVYYYTTIL